MKPIYKILIGLVVLVLFAYSLFVVLSKKQPATPANTITGPALTVPTQNGGSMQVSDITKNPQEDLGNGDTIVIEQNQNFSIVYFSKDQSFLITILNTPVQQYRDQAEAELLSKLQISQSQACQLNVVLTVPASVDESLAGQDYGLSFCPSGLPFPTQ